jgi:hypothetical protein
MLDLLSSCSDKRPIELSFSMTLSRAVFSSCCYSASFEVIRRDTCTSLKHQETSQNEQEANI